MNSPKTSLKDKTAPDYHPFANMAIDNDSYSHRMRAILKDHPRQIAYILVQEIQVPLGHINLSVEMLESLIKDNDLKIYLDVIMRNSIRINNLTNKLLINQPAGDVQAGKYSIHQLPDQACLK